MNALGTVNNASQLSGEIDPHCVPVVWLYLSRRLCCGLWSDTEPVKREEGVDVAQTPLTHLSHAVGPES